MKKLTALFVLMIVMLSSSVTAITFEIPHDDEIYQVQQMQTQPSKVVNEFQTSLEALQAEIEDLKMELIVGSNRYESGIYGTSRLNHRYRNCVQDLIDDQQDLLRDALLDGREIDKDDLDDLRDQERRCRRYENDIGSFGSYSSTYYGSYSGYGPSYYDYYPSFSTSSCRYSDPYFPDWEDYLGWRRDCERRFPSFYDRFGGYRGYEYDDYVRDADYRYGDDYDHYYYDEVLGRSYGTVHGFASYHHDFDRGARFSYDSPAYYLHVDEPGVTRPDRSASYTSAAYTSWGNHCRESADIDGRLSEWCIKRLDLISG